MKAQEAHDMSDQELQQEADRLRRHLYDLKSQAVTEKLEDPTQLGKTRRDVARLVTEQRQRQIDAQQETKA